MNKKIMEAAASILRGGDELPLTILLSSDKRTADELLKDLLNEGGLI